MISVTTMAKIKQSKNGIPSTWDFSSSDCGSMQRFLSYRQAGLYRDTGICPSDTLPFIRHLANARYFPSSCTWPLPPEYLHQVIPPVLTPGTQACTYVHQIHQPVLAPGMFSESTSSTVLLQLSNAYFDELNRLPISNKIAYRFNN